MILAVQILIALLCVAAGYLLPMKLIPWAFVRIGRMLGFRMRATPLTAKRIQRFKSIRRGHWSFVILMTAFFASLFLELVVNNKPLYISYGDHWQMPAVVQWVEAWVPFVGRSDIAASNRYGIPGGGELRYREYAQWVRDPNALEQLADKEEQAAAAESADGATPQQEAAAKQSRADANRYRLIEKNLRANHAFILMPLYPASPSEQLLNLPGVPPVEPFRSGFPLLGTDSQAKDVLAQVVYGFRVSLSFAAAVAVLGYLLGVAIGAIMGFFGGWTDILTQRWIEVWAAIPFLYILMIVSSIVRPSFWLLCGMLLILRAWIGITFTIRGEFYRERARDYVQAARAIGVKTPKVMVRHILPNSLVPIVTFLPFDIVGFIFVLVSLDYLGFGLPLSTPSWGRLLNQGAHLVTNHPFLVYVPVTALALTLFAVVLIGESVREAFAPMKYARLR
jgi:microcin C transport system permease protein